jgi:hypothetical protein
MSREKLVWRKSPEPADYAAAEAFLALICSASRSRTLVRALRVARTTEHSAKDLLRASGLPLLPRKESSVRGDLKKIGKGKPLSPVLLIRGDQTRGLPLTVADGYHRICAVCYYDEHAPVAIRLV